MRVSLPLAHRAIEARPSALHDALDRAAVLALAELVLAIVDGETVLEIAELAGDLLVIAQGRAAGLHRLAQHCLDLAHERFDLFGLDAPRQPPGRDPRAPQGLADIDVAEPRDDALVEQGGFDRRLLVLEGLAKERRAEIGRQRLDPDALEQLVPADRGGVDQRHQSEAAVVVEYDPRGRIGVEDDVVVLARTRAVLRALVVELAELAVRTSCIDAHAAAHAQMDDE